MDFRQSRTKRRKDASEIRLQIQNDIVSNSLDVGSSMEKLPRQEIISLNMENILEKIFGFLDLDSIKTARLVNKMWGREGAKILITRCYISIPSTRKKPGLFIRKYSKDEMAKFQVFLSCKFNDVSRISRITVRAAGDLKRWKRFRVLGPQVTFLKIKNDDCVGEITDILGPIFTLLPNLKYINLEPTLTQNQGKLIRILASEMSKPENTERVLTVSCIKIHPCLPERGRLNLENLEFAEKLSNCPNIMLEELQLDMTTVYWPVVPDEEQNKVRVANVINKLLFNNRKVLKRLTLADGENYLARLHFPCMTSLSHVSLNFHNKNQSSFRHLEFPPAFRFSENVPNLESVVLTSINRFVYPTPGPSNDFFHHLFEHTGAAPSVKRLEYVENWSNYDIDPLLQNFPNLEEFQTVKSKNYRRMFQSLWTYAKNLKRLDVSMYLKDPVVNVAELESFITGFSVETVERIKKHPNLRPFTDNLVEMLKFNPSMLNLKDLKHVTIRFDGHRRDFLPKGTLAVSGEYVFKLMPRDTQQIVIEARTVYCGPECVAAAFNPVSKLANVVIKTHQESTGRVPP